MVSRMNEFFFFFNNWVFPKYVNILNASVVESTDDLTLVNDLYFFHPLKIDGLCTFLLKAKGPGK